MQAGEKYSLALSSTLNLDGTPTEPLYNAVSAAALCVNRDCVNIMHWTSLQRLWHELACVQAMQSTRSTLMDNYDYVMFGRIFKYKDAPGQGQVCRTYTAGTPCCVP